MKDDELAEWKRRARAAWLDLCEADMADHDAYYYALIKWALIAAAHPDLIEEIFRTTALETEP